MKTENTYGFYLIVFQPRTSGDCVKNINCLNVLSHEIFLMTLSTWASRLILFISGENLALKELQLKRRDASFPLPRKPFKNKTMNNYVWGGNESSKGVTALFTQGILSWWGCYKGRGEIYVYRGRGEKKRMFSSNAQTFPQKDDSESYNQIRRGLPTERREFAV